MVGIRSQEEILRSFDGLEHLPGSKKKRSEPTELSEKRRKQVLNESNGWDENPIIKLVKGVETELFTISALAKALEKEVVTIRLWEKKGYIPSAPFRLRSKSLNGKKVNGNRVYTRPLVEIVIQEFSRRGLLGSSRVEWSKHQSLTEDIIRRWKLELNQTD
jgi:hypothetical protein